VTQPFYQRSAFALWRLCIDLSGDGYGGTSLSVPLAQTPSKDRDSK